MGQVNAEGKYYHGLPLAGLEEYAKPDTVVPDAAKIRLWQSPDRETSEPFTRRTSRHRPGPPGRHGGVHQAPALPHPRDTYSARTEPTR